MKKQIFSFVAALLCLQTAMGQQYILVDGELPIPSDEVLQITYEEDPLFTQSLLSGCLAADPRTQIFSEALRLTGLADTLSVYWRDYRSKHYEGESYYFVLSGDYMRETAWWAIERPRRFTVFAETDDVYAAQGISRIEELKAYASQIYDQMFPEDAGITDPTDRRNSLNRYVAYHILNGGMTYYYLTAFDNGDLALRFFRDQADIAAWYATLMPAASLKCSYPAGSEEGLYLNRRGVKDGPDKYGVQVRGTKLLPFTDEGDDRYTHQAINGCYYYIDKPLTYSQQTRDEVLGGERWRVDFKTMLPDIMNVYERGDYFHDDPELGYSGYGRGYIFEWDGIENITYNDEHEALGLISRRPRLGFWSYEGDELITQDRHFDISLKLPPLPEGDWEVRMGYNALSGRPDVRVWLNGQMTIDSLVMSRAYRYEEGMLWSEFYQDNQQGNICYEIIERMAAGFFELQFNEAQTAIVFIKDRQTGELLHLSNPISGQTKAEALRMFYQRLLYPSPYLTGFNFTTEQNDNWGDRIKEYRNWALKGFMALLPKMLKGPSEYGCSGTPQSSSSTPLSDIFSCVRVVLGRLHSDGKTDNHLRLKSLWNENLNTNIELMLDYLEFCPVSIADNE